MSGGEEARLLGRWGEEQAAEYLRRLGWTILASGYRCRFGEIDLIARRGEYLAFVEVKLRRSSAFAPACAFVDRRKQERLRATAQIYLAREGSPCQPRFDVIEVYAPQGRHTRSPEIHWIENAF